MTAINDRSILTSESKPKTGETATPGNNKNLVLKSNRGLTTKLTSRMTVRRNVT